MRFILKVTFSPASKSMFCLSSLWKASFKKGRFLTAQWLTTASPTAEMVSATWGIPQGTVKPLLVSFGLSGASLDPSQSFNHPGEIESCTVGRLHSKIRDDLMALPEKSNGDSRWQLFFLFSCLRVTFWSSDRDSSHLWQMPDLGWITPDETNSAFNLRCGASLLCIPAKYSWDGDNLSALCWF